MRGFKVILIIGIIEILIGSATLFTNFILIVASANHVPPRILLFVIVAGAVSTLIGLGILKFKREAYYLLLYFSSLVLFSKLMVFLGVIQFNGTMQGPLPSVVKDSISVAYHLFVIYYLLHPDVKKIFNR